MLVKQKPIGPRLTTAVLAALLLLLGVAGCDSFSGPSIVRVIGEVRVDRRPLDDAIVAFIPIEFRNSSGAIKSLAFGKTGNTGRFELRTPDTKGVLPGEYRVLIFRSLPQSRIKDVTSERSSFSSGENAFIASLLDDILPFGESDLAAGKPHFRPLIARLKNGNLPLRYNLESRLRYTVTPGAGVLYPKFDLQTQH